MTVLRNLQQEGRQVFKSREISRVHRERLLENGYLQEVIKGWLISSSPEAREGDSTLWYASFWEFCSSYCGERFGEAWHLSPEQSLLHHAEKTVIPTQVIVYAPGGGNHNNQLLFGTSLYDLRQPQMPPTADLTTTSGLRVFTAEAAIVRVAESFFIDNPIETQVVLASIGDASGVLRRLLEGGHTVIAGRLAGGFRRIGRPEIADEILAAMKAAGYAPRESDPFSRTAPMIAAPVIAPIVGRIRAIWETTREKVVEIMPKPPGLPGDKAAYLQHVEDIYRNDAYHSLSIEGYKVSMELIERVRAGNWDPEHQEADKRNRDALAARGYWQAFQTVKASVGQIMAGANASVLVRTAHRDWYRELFQPCVAAGLLTPGALAGYRNDAVYLRTSRYVPPRWEAVRDAMPALFDLLEGEPEASVRAVLGHWMLGYIHPYPDGNGRMARFLMNAMLASGGYPWTIIRVEDRKDYLASLDRASVDLDIAPFAAFIAEQVRRSMEQA
jgi:fido (protein-threonine AMPylation protein)